MVNDQSPKGKPADPVTVLDWRDTSAKCPCPKCGKAGTCKVSADMEWCACRFTSEGGEKQPAKDGGVYWRHRLRPLALPVIAADIPSRLKEIPHWVVWRYTWKPPKGRAPGKWDKPPLNAKTGRAASTTDPASWSTFAEAMTAYQSGGLDGIGIVAHKHDELTGGGELRPLVDEEGEPLCQCDQTDDLVVLDLDKCRDPKTGEVQPWADEVLREVGGYAEASPSATGVRIIATGRKPAGRCREGPFEMYEVGRYVTVTGQRLPDSSPDVEERQEAISGLHARMFPPKKRGAAKGSGGVSAPKAAGPKAADDLSDDELMERAFRAKNGDAVKRLWDGDSSGYPSASEADQALCNHLAFWTNRDAARVDRLFRRSGLMRDKWDEQRGEKTYGKITIDNAIEGTTDGYGSANGIDFHSSGTTDAGQPRAKQPGQYAVKDGMICRRTAGKNGPEFEPLCNFECRIVEEVVRDDGAERTKVFVLQGRTCGGASLPRAEASAAEFDGMGWVTPAWGAGAVVEAGRGVRDNLRAAIQCLSLNGAIQRVAYAHVGWREIGGDWVYLHAGGGVGESGAVARVETAPPEPLAKFVLPPPPEGEALVVAVRASLGLLRDLAPDRIAFPVAVSPYRAALGDSDFSLHLVGPTGAFKTELAALSQQHFGPALDSRNLPAGWSSTGNSLEGLAFAAKDALLVVDDFAPGASPGERQRLDREADRLLRAQGNRAGRGRMRADGSLRPPKPPRGLILSTGEDVPRGPSLRSRVFVVEVSKDGKGSKGDVNVARLTECQRDAAAGLYAQALAGFVRWLAPRYGEVRLRLKREQAELRESVGSQGQHARTPGIVADLLLGLDYLLEFAAEAGAASFEETVELRRRGLAALLSAADDQNSHIAASEPAALFLRLLSSALGSGRAHFAARTGHAPCEAIAWGWRSWLKENGGEGDPVPQGRRIGWLGDGQIYLDAEAAFAEAQRLANDQGESFPVTQRTLWKRLHERGFLCVDKRSGKVRFTVRRTLEGRQREVACLPLTALGPTDHAGEDAGGVPAVDTSAAESAHLDTSECPLGHSENGECPPENAEAARGYV